MYCCKGSYKVCEYIYIYIYIYIQASFVKDDGTLFIIFNFFFFFFFFFFSKTHYFSSVVSLEIMKWKIINCVSSSLTKLAWIISKVGDLKKRSYNCNAIRYIFFQKYVVSGKYCLSIIIFCCVLTEILNLSKLADCCWGWSEGSHFNSYYTKV